MTTQGAHTPSPGAVKAMRVLCGASPGKFSTAKGWLTAEEIAQIIEDCTHAGELLAALEMCAKGLRDVKGNSVLREWKELAAAAIRKAKEKP